MTKTTTGCTYGPDMSDLAAYRRATVLGLRGIRYTDAGATGAEGAAAAAAAAPTPTPADAAAAAGTQQAAAAAAAGTEAGAQAAATGQQVDTTGWPQAAIDAYNVQVANAAKYQREAGDSRINAKTKAAADERTRLLTEFQKLIDPTAAAGAEPTVEGLTATLGTKDSTIAGLQRANAATTEAWSQGVDPTKLGYLNYQLSQDAEFAQLDPTAPDFGDKVKASVAALVAKDATLKLTGSAVASGVESLGGASGSATITPEAFAAMNMADRTALYNNDRATYDRLTGRSS